MAYNILVVDDSEIIRKVLIKTLLLAKVSVGELYEAANGKEALEILGDSWIDLVFADINMPVMNGVEMIEMMSKDGLLDKIPVVVISTESSSTRINELKIKGVRAYIQKPFTPEMVKKVVNDVMGEDDD
ncbi:MAG: response regulator [Thermodesulfobacteriota bacterium]|nr:response regulator [Thermodesulfobacteriota bacterium]